MFGGIRLFICLAAAGLMRHLRKCVNVICHGCMLFRIRAGLG